MQDKVEGSKGTREKLPSEEKGEELATTATAKMTRIVMEAEMISQ